MKQKPEDDHVRLQLISETNKFDMHHLCNILSRPHVCMEVHTLQVYGAPPVKQIQKLKLSNLFSQLHPNMKARRHICNNTRQPICEPDNSHSQRKCYSNLLHTKNMKKVLSNGTKNNNPRFGSRSPIQITQTNHTLIQVVLSKRSTHI